MTSCANSGGSSGTGTGAPSSAGKQKRQLFPEKLWDLVNNQPSSGIFWSKNGKRIEIDRGQLEKFLQTSFIDKYMNHNQSAAGETGGSSSCSLPSSVSSTQTSVTPSQQQKHSSHSQSTTVKFRSHNFDSFIRQLHFYGFKKSGNSYHHEKFQRDRPEALYTMKRKYSSLPIGGGAQLANPISADSPKREARAGGTLSRVMKPRQLPTRTTKSPRKRAVVYDELYTPSPPPTLLSEARSPSPRLSSPSFAATTTTMTTSTSDIKMYTIDSTGDDDFSFTNVRETSVKAIREGKSMKISIPDFVMNNQQDDSWPKTLVLENQNVLSAYFIYKLN